MKIDQCMQKALEEGAGPTRGSKAHGRKVGKTDDRTEENEAEVRPSENKN